jgi:hypothetical protein
MTELKAKIASLGSPRNKSKKTKDSNQMQKMR